MINTSRLLIRHFQEQDSKSLFEYLSNPSIYRFEPGEPISLEKAKELALERVQGTNFWAVILKSTQVMVGHLYFTQTDPKEFLTWELGIFLTLLFIIKGMPQNLQMRLFIMALIILEFIGYCTAY